VVRRPRYPHPDANQAEIVQALRACGFLVLDVSSTLPTPDILVWGYDLDSQSGFWTAWEIKTPAGKLTRSQRMFAELWPGAVQIARCAGDVLAAYGRN